MNLQAVVLAIHAGVCLFIIGLVLLQRGKGADAGAAFGSGASGTVFGAKGSANFLSRSTALLAAVFFATSLGLAFLGSQRPVATSIVDEAVSTGTGITATEPQEELLPGESGGEIDIELGELPGLPVGPDEGAAPEQN
jgi:preprotein translocase subunit SecG